jgi:hypothetical protein
MQQEAMVSLNALRGNTDNKRATVSIDGRAYMPRRHPTQATHAHDGAVGDCGVIEEHRKTYEYFVVVPDYPPMKMASKLVR